MFRHSFVALLLLPLVATAADPAANVTPLDGHNFTLPPGFTIERVASADLCSRSLWAVDLKTRPP